MSILEVLDSILQDSSGVLTEAQKSSAVELATARVLVDYPLYVVEQLIYVPEKVAYSMPTGWREGISFIESIWDDQGRRYKWAIALLEGERYIRPYLSHGFWVSYNYETMRFWVRYSTYPSSDNPLSPQHEYLIGVYAAYLCLEMLANHYAQASDPTVTADVVNYRDKSRIYSDRADKMLELYYKTLGEWRYGS